VVDGAAKITHLRWSVSEQHISRTFAIPEVLLVNDLGAAAYGIEELQEEDLLVLQGGRASEHGPAVVLGVGTGFGQAMMVRREGELQLFPSEGGHVDFAPRNRCSAELLSHLWRAGLHVSVETVLSGSGLESLYSFLLERSTGSPGSAVTAAGIIELAVPGAKTAKSTFTQFVGDLGAQAAHAALC